MKWDALYMPSHVFKCVILYIWIQTQGTVDAIFKWQNWFSTDEITNFIKRWNFFSSSVFIYFTHFVSKCSDVSCDKTLRGNAYLMNNFQIFVKKPNLFPSSSLLWSPIHGFVKYIEGHHKYGLFKFHHL